MRVSSPAIKKARRDDRRAFWYVSSSRRLLVDQGLDQRREAVEAAPLDQGLRLRGAGRTQGDGALDLGLAPGPGRRVGPLDAALAILRHANGNEVLTLGHVSSGAMVTGLVEHAKGIAFRRDLAAGGSPTGLGHADFEAAVSTVRAQNIDMDHSAVVMEMSQDRRWTEVAVEKVPKVAA